MQQEKNNLDCAVVIPSCDNYEDSWLPFFSAFFKYWPDCPFPIYLVTEHKKYPDERVRTLLLGNDQGWANNMKIVLNQIPENYFLYFLEDVFLTKRVDTDKVLDLLNVLKLKQASCLRLYPSPGPDRQYPGRKDLGIIGENAPYRVSTMTAIWKKNVFLNLLKPGENAWQMEIDGTKRSWQIKDLFLSVWPESPAVDYLATAIKRGRWQYEAVVFCEKEGIPADFTRRPVETRREYWWRLLRRLPVLGRMIRLPGYLKKNAKKLKYPNI